MIHFVAEATLIHNSELAQNVSVGDIFSFFGVGQKNTGIGEEIICLILRQEIKIYGGNIEMCCKEAI